MNKYLVPLGLALGLVTYIALGYLAAPAHAQTVPNGTQPVIPVGGIRSGPIIKYVLEGEVFQPPAGHQLEYQLLDTMFKGDPGPSSTTPSERRVFLQWRSGPTDVWWTQMRYVNRFDPNDPGTHHQPSGRKIEGCVKWPGQVRVIQDPPAGTDPDAVKAFLVGHLQKAAL